MQEAESLLRHRVYSAEATSMEIPPTQFPTEIGRCLIEFAGGRKAYDDIITGVKEDRNLDGRV